MASVGKITLSVTVTHQTSVTIDIQGFELAKQDDYAGLYLKLYLSRQGQEIKVSKQKTATFPKNFIYYLNHLAPDIDPSELALECSVWKATSLTRHPCLGGCCLTLTSFPTRTYRLFAAEDRKNPASPCSPHRHNACHDEHASIAPRRTRCCWLRRATEVVTVLTFAGCSVVRKSGRLSALRAMSLQDLRRKRSYNDLNDSDDGEVG